MRSQLLARVLLVLLPAGLCAPALAAIQVTNVTSGTVLRYPVAFLQGTTDENGTLRVRSRENRRPAGVNEASILEGRFKALVELAPGKNRVELKAGRSVTELDITYRPMTTDHQVKVIYVAAEDGDYRYQTPGEKDPQDYTARLDTAAKLMQTFTAERMKDAGYGRQTFNLELGKDGKVVVHTVRYPAAGDLLRSYDGNKLFDLFYPWVDKQFPMDVNRCMVIMAFTRFDPATKKTGGHTALGGGGMGLFGSGDLFSWPASLRDAARVFLDGAPVPDDRVLDDSAFRGTIWGVASTTIGATLHEMGHTFGLPHVKDPESIMSRGFDHFNRFFTCVEPPTRGAAQPTRFDEDRIARWDADSAAKLAADPWFQPDGAGAPNGGDRPMGQEMQTRWRLADDGGIVWNVANEAKLPHSDHVEMSGRRVSLIATYAVGADRRVAVQREVVWPMLRIKPDDVRGYLIRRYGAEGDLRITADGKPYALPALSAVRLDGVLTLRHDPVNGLAVTRTLYPATDDTAAYERWELRNVSGAPVQLAWQAPDVNDTATGMYGAYVIGASAAPSGPVQLAAGESATVDVRFDAHVAGTPVVEQADPLAGRRARVAALMPKLRLETPDPVLNRAFDFAKLRAAESLFQTKMGLVHSPGGGRYYGGIWANDQAEYSGPLFPFLGDEAADEAALTAYRVYKSAINAEWANIPSSFEMEGDIKFHAGGDRGDAAMVAYGASRFALARGDRQIAEELLPLVEWCLEYCKRKTTTDGVVASDTDELEGRFPTGKANLSTSTLCYGGLRAAAHLASDLGKPAEAKQYDARADQLAAAIERYFGAKVEGLDTYRYYDGNDVLRSWICLPLTMGLFQRAQGTIQALFSPRLWTADGLATQAGDKTFWDRATLYGLRGVFAAGESKTALAYLTAYTQRRLLGEHVPYPVEAWPEGGQAHLSAESALYCRVFTEGLFGITPTGLNSFTCQPRLPDGWDGMALRDIHAFGHTFDLVVTRQGSGATLDVLVGGRRVQHSVVADRGVAVTLR